MLPNKYTVKMYSTELIKAASIPITFYIFCIADSKIISFLLLFLFIVEILALVRQPRFLFKKRLNEYFIVHQYPFYKWKSIYQQPFKKGRLHTTGLLMCKGFYRNLSKQMKTAFDFVDAEHGYYRTITHSVIKARLIHEQNKGKLQIITCEPAYLKSLEHIQKHLFYNRCKKCPDSSVCYFKKLSIQPRQFYYIEFYIPKHLI